MTDFGDVKYWDQRYAKDQKPFDWLLPATSLDESIASALKSSTQPRPRLLHLGCGTSSLSYHLWTFVEEPGQVWNVDYSLPAIELGRKHERELHGEGEGKGMGWSVLDMLSKKQVVAFMGGEKEGERRRGFDVIVDKSTCDSICCGPDITVQLPHLYTSHTSVPANPSLDPSEMVTTVHPFDLLGIHLAYMTPPGARWIALSFSQWRFDAWFSDTEPTKGVGDLKPGDFWRVESVQKILVKEESEDHSGATHRPDIMHYLFVLVRTEQELGTSP